MRKRLSIKLSIILGLLIASALILSVFPAGGWSQTVEEICPVPTLEDSDNDGFPDFYECTTDPATMLSLTRPLISGEISISGYAPGTLDRSQWMHPTEPDLFVILVRETGGNIPYPGDPGYFDPFGCITRAEADGGLGIGVHLSDPFTPSDRVVSHESPQMAVSVTEDLDPDGTILGIASYGTPMDYDRGRVYTQRIINFITEVCANASEILDIDGNPTTVEELSRAYIQHTIAHEKGHMLKLTSIYEKRFGGYHWKAGSGFVLDQSVEYTSKKGVVRFYIPMNFAGASMAAKSFN